MIINGFKSRKATVTFLAAAGFNMATALAKPESNPKVSKNGKMGVLTRPLHLAPARVSGFNTCAMATPGCIAACLHTAGNPVYMKGKARSRIAKTRAYMGTLTRPAFVALIAFEIAATIAQAGKLELRPGIRLNATSDIAWETVPVTIDGVTYLNLMSAFPQVTFYDYTAITKRAKRFATDSAWPANYHLTFSRKETASNQADALEILQAGGNVAMVASPDVYAAAVASGVLLGFPVIDGDAHDYRPADGRGVIAILKAKGDAKADASGFVLRNAA